MPAPISRGGVHSTTEFRLNILRVIFLSLIALPIGTLSAWMGWLLLKMIAVVVNLVYGFRLSFAHMSMPGHLPWTAFFITVGGALIVGFLARYGSQAIRGHGIPEAMESRVQPGRPGG